MPIFYLHLKYNLITLILNNNNKYKLKITDIFILKYIDINNYESKLTTTIIGSFLAYYMYVQANNNIDML